jgi:hypothetical protein
VKKGKLIAALAALPVAALIGCTSTHTASSAGAGQATPSTGLITGALADWLSAICRTGSFNDGLHVFRNATAGGNCQARNGGPIFMGRWGSNYLMQNDVVLYRNDYYASCVNGQRVTDFVAGRPSALQPLTQFGFTIQPTSGLR